MSSINQTLIKNPSYAGGLNPSGAFKASLRKEENVNISFKTELARIRAGVGTQKPGKNSPAEEGERLQSPSSFEYTVKRGDTLWELAVKRFHVNLEDLIRDNKIENPNLIFPGQKLIIRRPEIPLTQEVTASWYGADYHGRPMADGNPFDMHAATIAHKSIPLGTRVELENPSTGEKVRAVVTDRGPFIPGRDVDLSYALAKKLSLLSQGVGKLIMKVI